MSIDTDSVPMDRRRFMKTLAAGTGASAVGIGASVHPRGPVQESEALVPGVIWGAAAVTGLVVNWAIDNNYGPLGSDNTSTGLSSDVTLSGVYDTCRTRKSTNLSSIVDNQNILQGVDNTAHVEGKIAAIEQLNNGGTQAEVETAATDAADAYATTVKKNLLKTWSEAVRELVGEMGTVDGHSSLVLGDTIDSSPFPTINGNYTFDGFNYVQEVVRTLTMPDGTTHDVSAFKVSWDCYDTVNSGTTERTWTQAPDQYTQVNDNSNPPPDMFPVLNTYGSVNYLRFSDWNGIWSEMNTVFTNVKDGLILWVDNIYGDVQSGEIDETDLLTPAEQAALMSDEEKYPQAMADLIALNIPVDLEREARISIDSKDITLNGKLGLTSPPSDPLQVGNTYDPTTFGTTYFTYDISEGRGVWSDYETGLNGGEFTLTAEPYIDSEYIVTTVEGEVATALTGDFTEGTDADGNAEWVVDLSDQLEQAIVDVEKVDVEAQTDTAQYETVQLRDPFTLERLIDSDGVEHDETNFTQNEPQDDTNYITQAEFDEMQQRNQRLIEELEAALNDDGGGGTSGGSTSIADQLRNWARTKPAEAGAMAVGITGLGYLYAEGGD